MEKVELNKKGEKLIIGCNYHTTWQSHKNMRFVLTGLNDKYAELMTRRTGKQFWTDKNDLIFIKTSTNINKSKKILKENWEGWKQSLKIQL